MCIPTSSAATGVPFPVLQRNLLEQTTLSNLATCRLFLQNAFYLFYYFLPKIGNLYFDIMHL